MGCREVRIGQAGRGRAQGGERPIGATAYGGKGLKGRAAVSGERPIGAASCRQAHNQASCQPPSAQTCLRWSRADANRRIGVSCFHEPERLCIAACVWSAY